MNMRLTQTGGVTLNAPPYAEEKGVILLVETNGVYRHLPPCGLLNRCEATTSALSGISIIRFAGETPGVTVRSRHT